MDDTSTKTAAVGMGLNGNAPWLVKFVASIGVPSAALIYLVYFMGQIVLGAIESHAESQAGEMKSLIAVTRQVCANTADTDAARSLCFPEPR
jgi:hypothetical protein